MLPPGLVSSLLALLALGNPNMSLLGSIPVPPSNAVYPDTCIRWEAAGKPPAHALSSSEG